MSNSALHFGGRNGFTVGGVVVNLISQQQKLAIHGSRKNPLPLSLKNHFPYDGLNPNWIMELELRKNL